MAEIRKSSLGRFFDPEEIDAETLAATTEDGACEVCGRERLHTLGGQSTYDACTQVGRCFLYYTQDDVLDAGYAGVEDPALDDLGLTLDEERGERRKSGPVAWEGDALDWARDFEEDHPHLWWSALRFVREQAVPYEPRTKGC